MANPIVTIAVPVAGILAAQIGRRAAEVGWGAVFGEDAPTTKADKAAQKDVAKRRKQAKKDGLYKAEIAQIRTPQEEMPVWKPMLWAVISGVLLQGLRMVAQRGAKSGAERLTTRRPRANRG